MADATYIEPITWQTVAQIIEKERPDAVLPTMGGQTALNCALALDENGVLEKYNVELIGASKDAIEKAEDRKLFDIAMRKIGLECPRADVAENMEHAWKFNHALASLSFRPSFTMGGSGGGIAYNKEELLKSVNVVSIFLQRNNY
jgi:carbamoyl-phosphate synthase large subunit